MESELRTLNGRYRLLERIGSGGMAAVFRAQDLKLGRFVAIKMLHESLTSDEGFLRRFQKEAHAAANLTHPNIVTVHDIGQDGHRHYIVMEFIDGQTLKFGPLATTRRAGPPALMDQESKFLGALEKVAGYRLEETGLLYLIDDMGKDLIRFSKMAN